MSACSVALILQTWTFLVVWLSILSACGRSMSHSRRGKEPCGLRGDDLSEQTQLSISASVLASYCKDNDAEHPLPIKNLQLLLLLFIASGVCLI